MKTAMILLLILVASAVGALDWLYQETATLTWAAPADAQVGDTYEIWRQGLPDEPPEFVAEVDGPPITITVGRADGSPWAWGVRSKRVVDGDTRFSVFLWGDVEGSPAPWVMYYRQTAQLLTAPVTVEAQ